ncbi:MAG: delta-60 repeat domain-containing protein [Limisphaerales bacterium]
MRTVLPLADGKILVGGSWNNQTNIGMIRFGTNGVRDATWLGVMPGETYAISLVASNKLILAGNGFVRRTTYDGATDAVFNPGTFFSGPAGICRGAGTER